MMHTKKSTAVVSAQVTILRRVEDGDRLPFATTSGTQMGSVSPQAHARTMTSPMMLAASLLTGLCALPSVSAVNCPVGASAVLRSYGNLGFVNAGGEGGDGTGDETRTLLALSPIWVEGGRGEMRGRREGRIFHVEQLYATTLSFLSLFALLVTFVSLHLTSLLNNRVFFFMKKKEQNVVEKEKFVPLAQVM